MGRDKGQHDSAKKPYESLRLQISKVSAMLDIGPKFSEAVTVNHLLSLILKQTLDLMEAEVCIIWLKDQNDNLVPRMSFGLKSSVIQSVKIKVSADLMKCIMNKDKPTYIDNLMEDSRIPLKRLIKKENLKSLLAAPLAVGEEKTGVLMICAKSRRRFHETDLKIFNALTRQSALAIANVGLYDRMGRKAKDEIRKITTLFTMSRSLSSAIELDMALDIILEKASALTKAKFCVLKLMNKSRRKLVTMSLFGLGKAKAKALAKFDDDIAKKVLRDGTTFVINDVNIYFKGIPPPFLIEEGVHSFIMTPLFSGKRKAGVLSFYIPEARIFEKEDIDMIEMVASFSSMVIDNATMLERIRKDYFNTIKTLANIIDTNDPYTRGHCQKVMKYSMMICRKLKLPNRHVNVIKTASLLHDIGKIGIDLSILRKVDKLNEEDWKKIRMHPEIGAKIVSQVGFLNEIVPIIKYHHARYDGGGYPDPNKRASDIPLGARIIAIADVFDAMTSERPYRKAMSKEEALMELKKCSGQQFDPQIVGAFLTANIV